MTPGRTPLSLLAVLVASTLAVTACGSDDDSSSTTTEASTATTTASTASSAVSLKDVCPSKVVIQTDWHPESDHSEAYALIDPATAKYDKGKKRVTGELVAKGQDTGVQVEVRAGGPAIGFQSPTQQMYTDKSITLGYVNTDESVQNSGKFPTVSVMAPREQWAQVLIFDPGTYDFKTIADIGKTDTKVLYFKGNVYMDYLTGAGILKKSQVDSSYDGKPARFVTSGGKVVQQGFITAEPWQYENTVKQWGKKVATLSIADAGYPNYGETLAVRKADITKESGCLKKLVPIIQQAQVDYAADPAATNAVIVQAAKVYNNGWEYPAELAAYAAKAQVDNGIIGNGDTPPLGDIDATRVQKMIDLVGPIYSKQNIKIAPGLKAADLFTNEFIDTKIGLPAK
ncbi:ABC transporter substrate-binding protein [Patulibacter sp. NPDC049589]|uniref:ABC transporter substrate-binding protein n=1 Tax=Patulibacter sp. NPDC049589 TaxID=3154731 RepID=UPI00341CA9DB